MSLDVSLNIVKGWPNPYIVEDSLACDVALAQGDVVTIGTNRKWVKGVTSANSTPYIITVDSTDPSTARVAHKAGYVQVPWGNIHGISLSNALEIETANYAAGSYVVGDALSAPAGKIQEAANGELIVGIVTKAPYQLGDMTYLTFMAENGKRVKA